MKRKACLKGLPMQTLLLRRTGLLLCLLAATCTAGATVSQTPLLSKTVNVRPNIALVLDTSGSMDWDCVYAKHVNDALTKDGLSAGNIPGLTTSCLSASDMRQSSPVNNKLFYDPKETYGPGYVAGVLQSNATLLTSTLTVYLPKAGVDPTTFSTSSAIKDTTIYDRYDVTKSTFKFNTVSQTTNPFGPHNGTRTDCASTTCTLDEERQNYANWKAYHYKRILAAKTGLSGAFVNQADNFRLAYTDIYSSLSTMTDFAVTQSAFYTWLDGRVASGGTPLRTALDNAGKYYQSTANAGPWGTKPWSPPSEKATDHLSCRRSYTLMITDGFYNDSSPPSPGNVDSKKGPALTYALDASKTYQYTPGDASDVRNRGKSDLPSGSGGYSDTLADIAMKYWVADLRTDLANDNGKGNPTDPPFWQNMTTYMVSFGAPGKMTDADVAKAKAGTLAWVQPAPDTYSAIDDMRHAAHNGGGDFLTVSNAQQFTTDLGNVIGSIAGQQFSQAGVAASAVTLTAGTKKFVPYYTSGTWWGNLQMIDLTASGDNGGIVWQIISTDANGQPTGVTTLPAPASRNIVVWADATKQAVPFTYTQITTAANNLKGTNANMQLSNSVTSDIVDFLRGVRTKEGVGLRKRSAVLGDIVNSTPAFVKNNTNPMFDQLPASTPGLAGYAAYMTAKAARTEGVLIVGANDGMLHAFAEGAGANAGGREVFAYVPRSVLGKLESLTQSGYTYAHTYTVDGPLTETDAYVTTPNLTTGTPATGWRNIVIGTTGAGAKSVFALNATDPLGMNGRAVLWEINPDPAFPTVSTNTTTAFAELGSVLTQPQSGITASGDWVTIFGNGYDSKSGKASLFIVNTGTGQLLKEITTDSKTSNGLGGIRLVLNSTQQIIGAYAGDLQGRVWKFDLSSTLSSGWKLGNGGVPLFTAMSGATPMPITAPPAVLERTDQAGFKPSYLVTVGTGKLTEAGDPNVTSPTQATYSLWDKQPFGATTAVTINESDLESIRIKVVTAGIDPTTGATINTGGITNFYTVEFSSPSVTKMDWTTKLGWKMNLDVNAGQRVIYPVQMVGDVVKIDTVAPQASTSNCVSTSSNALSLYVNPLTAACRIGGTLDTNADGKIDASDANVCAYSSLADGMDVILKILDSKGADTGLRDIQDSSGHIKVRTGGGSEPDCTDPVYAANNPLTCPTGGGTCADPAYRAAHPGSCNGATINRSWRQIFPRAN